MQRRNPGQSSERAGPHTARLHIAPAPSAPPAATEGQPTPLRAPRNAAGIDVREEQLGTAKAQRLYQMRCECGRCWFELELPILVRCPACAKVSAVSLSEDATP